MSCWRHRVGHNLGIEGDERPFLDVGDETVRKHGMVSSVEPGPYVPGLGGFRHSDTVVVTGRRARHVPALRGGASRGGRRGAPILDAAATGRVWEVQAAGRRLRSSCPASP